MTDLRLQGPDHAACAASCQYIGQVLQKQKVRLTFNFGRVDMPVVGRAKRAVEGADWHPWDVKDEDMDSLTSYGWPR